MRSKILSVVILFVFSSFFAGCEKGREEFYNQALEYYHQKKFTESRLELRNALFSTPECAECFLLLGKLALEEGDLQSAFTCFRNATDFDPGLIESKVELGKLYLLAGDVDKAGEMVSRVLEEDGHNAEAMLVLASVLIQKEAFGESERLLEAVQKEDPDNSEIYIALNKVYLRQGKVEKAGEALLSGVALQPSNIELLKKAVSYFKDQGDVQRAEEFLEKLLLAGGGDPDLVVFAAENYSSVGRQDKSAALMEDLVNRFDENLNYRICYANLLISEHKLEEAENVLKAGLELDESSVDMRMALHDVYQSRNEGGKAVELLLEGAEAYPESPEAVFYRNQLATFFMGKNEPAKALEQLNLVIEMSPEDVAARYHRGRLYLVDGKGTAAVEDFRHFVKANPDNASAHLLLARAYLLDNEIGPAIDNFKKAVALDSGNTAAREDLINTYLSEKDWSPAVAELRRLHKKRPNDINVAAAIGDVYFLKGDTGRAAGAYHELIRDYPKSPVGYIKLAELALAEGKNVDAVTNYNRALRLDPGSLLAVEGKVDALLAQNKFTVAIKFCERRLKWFPDSPWVYEILGELNSRLGNVDEAESYFARAIELAPHWVRPYVGLGNLYVSSERVRSGIKKFTAKAAEESQHAGPQFVLGMLYEHAKKYKKARQTYTELLTKHPDFSFAANNLSYLLATRFSDSKEAVQEAIKLARTAAKSGSSESLDTLGYVLYISGDYAQALQALNSALKVNPDFASAQYHKALIYHREGKTAEAEQELRDLLQDNNEFPEKKAAKRLLSRL